MTPHALALPFVLGLLASFVACKDGDVGAPCDEDADCASGLECDMHEGQGSCQEPHGHETGHETEHATTEHAEDTGHETAHESGETAHESGQATGTSTGG